MADLITHLCTALLPTAFVRTRLTIPLTIGVVLPDAAARVPPMAMAWLRRAGVGIPQSFSLAFDALHTPAALLALSVLVAWCFRPDERKLAFIGLFGGSLLHLAVDVLQDHHGMSYHLLFPFSLTRWELGWIGSEDTVLIAGPLAIATAAAWGWRWRQGSRQRATRSQGS